MDTIQNYSRILNYVVCELSTPVKRHTCTFLANDLNSINHHLLSAASKSALTRKVSKSQEPKPDQNSEDNRPSRITINTENSQNNRPRSSSIKLNTVVKQNNYTDKHNVSQNDIGLEYFRFVNSHEKTYNSTNRDIKKKRTSSMNVSCNQTFSLLNNEMDTSTKQIETNIEICNESDKEKSDLDAVKLNGSSKAIQEDDVKTIENSEKDCDIFDHFSNDSVPEMFSDPLFQVMDEDFKNMYKVTRSTFKNLVEFLSKEEMEPIENIPLYKKLLIVLWLMGNSGSYRDAAEVFDVTEEAAANCFFDVCATLYNQSDNIITWPNIEECSEIATRIEKNYGFPGVVGVLGCHYFSISIPKEALSRREHFNAKQKTYCIALQIVCDDNLVIRDIFPGLPGGITEAQIFRKSPLCEQLASQTEANLMIEPNKHILARSLYPQLKSMLTPYTESAGTLSKEEVELNELHESVCQLVDQTLEMLQDRFATLRFLDPEVATMVLVVACVIHNFCIATGDLFESES